MKTGISFIDAVRQCIEDDEVVLPVFSPAAMKVQQELVKKEPDVRLLETIISGEQSLSTQVLQIANSSFYKGLVEVLTIRAAIVRLGMQEVGRIALLVASKNQFRSSDKELNSIVRKLWQHSVGTAMGAKWLSRRCRLDELESQAFFAGLLHDVGKLFVLMVIEQLKSRGREIPVNQAVLLEAMDSLHTAHGCELMKKWNIPEQYCVIARDHHLLDFDSRNYLLILVRLANMMCNRIGIGIKKDSALVVSATEEAHFLNLTEIDLAELEIFLEDTAMLTR